MNERELTKTINMIETYYARKLSDNEIYAISIELKDYTYDKFNREIKSSLLRLQYYTTAGLHQIIDNYKKVCEMKELLGIKSFDELYEN